MNNIHNVAADGECLFNAIAYGIIYLSGKSKKRILYKSLARKLRKETVKALAKSIQSRDTDAIVVMSAEDNNNQSDFTYNEMIQRAQKYVRRMSKSCSWGGQIELQVLGPIVHAYGYRGIKVYNAENKRLIMSSPIAKTKNAIIHIVLEDVNSGGTHYNFWNKSQKYKSSSLK